MVHRFLYCLLLASNGPNITLMTSNESDVLILGDISVYNEALHMFTYASKRVFLG